MDKAATPLESLTRRPVTGSGSDRKLLARGGELCPRVGTQPSQCILQREARSGLEARQLLPTQRQRYRCAGTGAGGIRRDGAGPQAVAQVVDEDTAVAHIFAAVDGEMVRI